MYTSNSSKGCVLEVDVEYSKELRQLHNNYLLAQDKMEIKEEMLSCDHLIIDDLYNTPISNIEKLVLNLLCVAKVWKG